MEENFPHFIADKPQGVDVFEGQSQTRLAKSISDYILNADKESVENINQASIPRIIGIEGSWGAGKSNVVAKVEEQLKAQSYYTFTYDSWGHQEDLQRRSILETLTNRLIEDKVLRGEVSIKMRNGRLHTAKWSDQLQMLLSNKTTTIIKSVPKFSLGAILGILLVGYFVGSSVVFNQLIDKGICFGFRWILVIELLPSLLVGCILLLYAICKNKREVFTTFLTQKDDSTIDEQFTSSEEPSITEFQNWMHAISNELEKKNSNTNKIIIVFDNMDRLPSSKVVQLWSLIYTFFAGRDFENIWVIIPFDYKHLCKAVSCNEGQNMDRFKKFINKTFPIIFTISKPVITDYRKLFKTFFEKAFGENEHDEELICQVFMCLEENPNPRTVICFVNDLVALRLQWTSERYRLQNLALYVLKKDFLLYNKDKSLEECLLSDELFDKVNSFYPQMDSVRVQLCQFSYGIEDEELAKELPLRNVLLDLIGKGNSILEYAESPYFVPVLESILSSAYITDDSLANAVKSFCTLDISKFDKKEQERLNKKWDALANIKLNALFVKVEKDETLYVLIDKASENCAKRLVEFYCSTISTCRLVNGADYYNVLSNLQIEIDKTDKKIDITSMLRKREVTPKLFEEYVNTAKSNYPIFKVTTNNDQLNQYILDGALGGVDSVVSMFELILNDQQYNFSILKKNLSDRIRLWHQDDAKGLRLPSLVNRLLHDGDGILKLHFNDSIINSSALAICTEAWDEFSKQGNEDIAAMYIANGFDVSNFKDEMVPRISTIIEKYISYSDLIKRLGSVGTALYKINSYMIENCIGEKLDVKYVALNMQSIKGTLNVTSEVCFRQFNRFSFKWDENDISSCKSYVFETLFKDYKSYSGLFTDGLITLAVKAMENQSDGFLTNDSYWISFVKVFIGTQYLPSTNEQLTKELNSQLDYVIKHDGIRDEDLLNCLLSNSPDEPTFISYINDLMSTYFAQNDVTTAKFKVFGSLFPRLEKDIAKSTCISLIEHFITPVYDNSDCAKIIVENQDFYLYVLENVKNVSQPILKKLVASEMYKSIHSKITVLIITEEKQELSDKK